MWFHTNGVAWQSSEQKAAVIEVTVFLLPGVISAGIQLMMWYYTRKNNKHFRAEVSQWRLVKFMFRVHKFL
jgi:cytochrome c oxidase assembly factor CtaG